jgi:hypothetical protein
MAERIAAETTMRPQPASPTAPLDNPLLGTFQSVLGRARTMSFGAGFMEAAREHGIPFMPGHVPFADVRGEATPRPSTSDRGPASVSDGPERLAAARSDASARVAGARV